MICVRCFRVAPRNKKLCTVHAGTCSKCWARPCRPGQRTCVECHAAWMRRNRKRHHELSEDARMKANARSYLNTYVRRGLISKPDRCQACGKSRSLEAHHLDYAQPLEVEWLCRSCRLEQHGHL